MFLKIRKSNFVHNLLDPQSHTDYQERGMRRTSAFHVSKQRCKEVEELTACVTEFSSTCDGLILERSNHACAFEVKQLTCWR